MGKWLGRWVVKECVGRWMEAQLDGGGGYVVQCVGGWIDG